MCLCDAKKIEQEGEIVCYKIVTAFYWEKIQGHCHSPYKYGTTWNLGEENTAKFNCYATKKNIIDENGNIESGAFHTLKTENDARDYFRYCMSWAEPWEFYIARCVIPSSNEYLYEGLVHRYYNDEELRGYASQKLKIVEFIRI